MKSAFGVEHGDISKGMFGRSKKVVVNGQKIAMNFKKVPPRSGPMTGPGSARGTMDPSAWATRTAAAKRGK